MSGRSVLLTVVAFSSLLGSLVLVVWRQGRVLEGQRSLERLRTERAVVEAEAAVLRQRIQTLESRSRVVSVAGARLGLRVPDGTEIVILPRPGTGTGWEGRP